VANPSLQRKPWWRRFVHDNGLSVALFGIFFLTIVGQFVTGLAELNQDHQQHGQPTLQATEYVTSGHFLEAVFENWESEFLQMTAYVVLTIRLRQKGASESKRLDGQEPVDADPRASQHKVGVPWPVRSGGLVLRLYENSLSLALGLVFALSFTLHAIGGSMEYNEDQRAHGSEDGVSAVQYLATSRFWFESFQNWQSEFFSLGAMVVLSIFLRQRGSPESKPVDTPHQQTGSE
jgi:hypothetical protein